MAFGFLKKHTKSKAMVFVDYEHWYFALNNNYKLKPDIEKFCNDLNEKYNVSSLTFFGDFSSAPLNSEMHKIRGFTNKIVETNNGGGHFKKDFTDFIMLDHIYQSAYTDKDIDTYIIFTGDGHFSSSVLFLKIRSAILKRALFEIKSKFIISLLLIVIYRYYSEKGWKTVG